MSEDALNKYLDADLLSTTKSVNVEENYNTSANNKEDYFFDNLFDSYFVLNNNTTSSKDEDIDYSNNKEYDDFYELFYA